MTTTEIREALHEVGAATTAPPPDRLAFEREVRAQRRRRTTGRVALAGLAAAAVAAAAVTVPQLRADVRGAADPAAPSPSPSYAIDGRLEKPATFVADGRLVAVDPGGVTHELDGRYEEVVGTTTEDIWAVDGDSHLVRWHASSSDEGPGGWRFERSDDLPYEGPVQSAALSGDGRWLGWVDLDETVTVYDLEAEESRTWGTDAPTGSRYLADVAQGSGFPLFAENDGLTLGTSAGNVRLEVPGGTGGMLSTASRSLVAVVGGDGTVVHEVGEGGDTVVRTLPGTATLSPYGEHLAVVRRDDRGRAVFSIWTRAEGLENVSAVDGDPLAAAWADDDTALVATDVDRAVRVYACEASDGTCVDLTPPQTAFGSVRLGG